MTSKKNALVYRVPKQGYEEVDPEEWSDMAICDVYDSAVNATPSARIRNANYVKAKPAKKANQVIRNGQGDNTVSPSKDPHCESKKTCYPNPDTDSKPSARCFKSGDTCIARYSEDNLYYKCTVLSVDNAKQTCLVEYNGYGNQENVNYCDIYTMEQWNSPGAKDKRSDSVTVSGNSSASCYVSTASTGSSTEGTSSDVTQDLYSDSRGRRKRGSGRRGGRRVDPPFDFRAPNFGPNPFFGMPPPPFSVSSAPDLSDEALSSMLMSWYMAGYHTGLYQGSRAGRGKKKK